eukprot:scaffold1364_cov383-Pinguiococcus_pyrenoidosus.AAC.1
MFNRPPLGVVSLGILSISSELSLNMPEQAQVTVDRSPVPTQAPFDRPQKDKWTVQHQHQTKSMDPIQAIQENLRANLTEKQEELTAARGVVKQLEGEFKKMLGALRALGDTESFKDFEEAEDKEKENMHHQMCVVQPPPKTRRSKDDVLSELVKEYGEGNWGTIHIIAEDTVLCDMSVNALRLRWRRLKKKRKEMERVASTEVSDENCA